MQHPVLQRVELLISQGRIPDAEKQIRSFLEEDPTSEYGRYLLAFILYFQGKSKESEQIALQLQQEDPENPAYLALLAEINLKEEELDEYNSEHKENFEKEFEANQGVIKNATSVDMITLIGTLNAIGAMYGPIIPVINASGTNAKIIVSVDIKSAGRISDIDATIFLFLSVLSLPFKNRLILSIPVMGSSTSNPSDRIKANKVTRLIV